MIRAKTPSLFLIAALALTACHRGGPSDKLDDNQLTAANVTTNTTAPKATPAHRCASTATYELIKRELFRRAAQLRGKDDAVFDRLATAAALRIERPVVTSQDEGLGSIGCSASVALDLPPGLAVAGGRSSLPADLTYTLQPAADGSGDVVTLTNADAITVPLATLGRSGATTASPLAPAATLPAVTPSTPAPANPPTIPPPAVRPAPDPLAPRASANPSFGCGRARTRGEITICQDPGLALLDRRMAAQFQDAIASATDEQRARLRATGRRFYGFRDNCPDARCIASGYRGRMREIDDIMRSDG